MSTRFQSFRSTLAILLLAVVTGCSGPILPYSLQQLNITSEPGILVLPEALTLTNGLCIIDGRRTVAYLAGPDCVLLADLTGPNNRCELLLRREGRYVLYDRVGQRRLARSAAQSVLEPTAVTATATPRGDLAVSLKLYLQRSERWPLNPFTERFPRQLLLSGSLRVQQIAADNPTAPPLLATKSLLTDQPETMFAMMTQLTPPMKRTALPGLAGGPPLVEPEPVLASGEQPATVTPDR